MALTRRLPAAAALLCVAALLVAAHAEPLPRDERERACWQQHARERTRIKLNEPTVVDVVNVRDGDMLRSPFRVDFAIRGMGVIPAGKPHPKAGHHHILVDTPLPLQFEQSIPFNDFHRHFGKGQTGTVIALPPGRHTLRLLFADQNHKPYFVFSPELRITVTGPRSDAPPRWADAGGDCTAWYAEERTRPRPPGQRAVIANLRDGEAVTSPFSVLFAVDGFGVAPRGNGGEGLGHFVFDVLRPDGSVLQNNVLAGGATQMSLFLANGSYRLRLRFVDDSGRRELVPAEEIAVTVTAQERL